MDAQPNVFIKDETKNCEELMDLCKELEELGGGIKTRLESIGAL